MEGTRPRTVNSIGMFDMLKGVGMITIVLAHTAELYPMQISGGLSLTAFFPFIYREALMAAFFIASGYGFRKRSIGKCISQQFKTLFKPYAYTGLATTIAHFVIHYKTFGNWNNAVYETYKVLGGFVLGLPHTATYFGQAFFSCGPMWYLLACFNSNMSSTISKNELEYYDDAKTMLKTELIVGCFFVIKTEIIQKVDYLDENTFLFCEERILGKKLKDNHMKRKNNCRV